MQVSSAIAAIVEAYRARAADVGGYSASLSCSQQPASISLSQRGTGQWLAEAQDVLGQIKEDELYKLVQEAQDADVFDLLKALQHTCAADAALGRTLCLAIVQMCIREPGATAGRRGREVFNFVTCQAAALGASDSANNVVTILEAMSNANENFAKVLELLPTFLLTASKEATFKVRKMSTSSIFGDENTLIGFTSSSFRDHVFQRLCGNSSVKWPRCLVVPLLTTIRDLHPDEKELKMTVRKISREASQLELQELPPCVYQLLLLSTHGQRQSILELVLDILNRTDKELYSEQAADMASQLSQITESRLEENELIHVQGTVIHHFVFAVRQDLVLAKELLNVLRVRQCMLSTFEMALILSLVRLDRYSSKASEILRKAFLQDFAHHHKIKSSAWVSSIEGLATPSDMRQKTWHVVRRSAKGWEHVVPGIVVFAMSNLEWAAKKCSTGGGAGRSNSENVASDAQSFWSSASGGGAGLERALATGFTTMASDLQRAVSSQLVLCCTDMLETTFRHHTAVRDEILGQILSRVLTRDDSVKYVVQLLARIATRCSKDVIDCLPKIKESLEYLAFMPTNTAVALIRALSPVLRLSASLLDYLIIILRKALFSREADARIVALQGFLLLAQGNLCAWGAGGVDQDQDSLALEIIGQLRRTMVQQVYMRERLYDGLCDMVRAKPYLINDVAAVLLPQLQRYCHNDGSGSLIISLEKCVDGQNMIVEPIGKLLRAVSVCVSLKINAKAAEGAGSGGSSGGGESTKGKESAQEDEGVIGTARSLLDKLAAWLSETDPEDFDMDKETDFSSAETHHLSIARLLVGMHEALFEHTMLKPQVKVGQEKRLFRGVRKLHSLLELVSTAKPSSKGGGSKGRKGSTVLDERNSLLSNDFARRLLAAEDREGADGGAEHVDLCVDSERSLRKAIFDDEHIISLALETAQRQLLEVGRIISNDSMQEGNTQSQRMHVIQLSPLLLRQFYFNLPSKRCATNSGHAQLFKGKKVALDRDSGVELALVALHGLQMCVNVACVHFSRAELCEMAAGLEKEFETKRVKAGGDSFAGLHDADVPIDPDTTALFDARITKCIEYFQQLCSQLLAEEEPDYAAMVAETIYILQGQLSLEARLNHQKWAQNMCKNPLQGGSDHQGLAKALLANLLRITQCEHGLDSLIAIGKDMEILFRVDDDEGERRTQAPRSPEYDIVREDTQDLLFTLTTDAVKACCEDVEWVWDSQELNARPDLTENDECRDTPQVEALISQTNFVEDEALRRLNRAVDAVWPLARCLENEYSNKELVIKALTRVYRAAEHVSKKVEQRRGVGVRKPFVQLMVRIGTQLNDALYELLLRFDVASEEKARGKRQKITNESRLVPALVYQVELLEAHLIKIHKAQGNLKAFDFMKHFKRSTARDFKIDYGVMQKLAKDDDGDCDEGKKKSKGKGKKRKDGTGNDAENLSVNTQASAKRSRV